LSELRLEPDARTFELDQCQFLLKVGFSTITHAQTFTGEWADPFITADGSHFYFISNRPVAGAATPNLDIWVMEKTATGKRISPAS